MIRKIEHHGVAAIKRER